MLSWFLDTYRSLSRRQRRGEAPPWATPVMTALHVVVVLIRETVRDRLHVRAAMLGFWSSVATVPILLLAFALTGPLGLADETRSAVLGLLYDTVLAASVEEVGTVFDDLLESTSLRTLGIFGVLGIMAIGSQLFFMVELAYNDIFATRNRRSRLLRFTLFYAAITLAPLLIAGGFVASAKLGVGGGSFVARAVPVLLTGFVLVAAIRMLPGTDVKWRAAILGGLLSAIALEAAKYGFGVYTELLGTKDSMARIYGSLAFLPVFLLWLYVAWIIVLFGVEVAFLVHHYPRLVDDQRRHINDPYAKLRSPDAYLALSVMTSVAAHFVAGDGGVCMEDLVAETGAAPQHVRIVLDALDDIELITEDKDLRILPARPLDKLTAGDVLRTWQDIAAPEMLPDAPGRRTWDDVVTAAASVLDVTLDELGRRELSARPTPLHSARPG